VNVLSVIKGTASVWNSSPCSKIQAQTLFTMSAKTLCSIW